MMQKPLLLLLLVYSAINIYAQNIQYNINKDSVLVNSKVEFFTYNGPYGSKENLKKPAIRFILTVKNLRIQPIPDIDVTNRSNYVNLYINDSIQNPVSLYNGTEIIGEHLLKKNESDTYTWWLFEEEAYSKTFTIQWQYMQLFSKKTKVNMDNKTIELF